MGIYMSVRGWVELDHALRQDAERIIEADADGHYSGGWGWPAEPFNWTLCLFYGGDVREAAVGWLRDRIERLAALDPADEDGYRPQGLFIVADEQGEARWRQVRDGAVHGLSAPDFAWLAT